MAKQKARSAKKRGAAALERKRQYDGGSSAGNLKGYAIVVNGGAQTIGVGVRSDEAAYANA